MDRLTMTIPDWRKATGLGLTKTYELIAAGDIEAVKVGARTLIVVASARTWLERLPRLPQQASDVSRTKPSLATSKSAGVREEER